MSAPRPDRTAEHRADENRTGVRRRHTTGEASRHPAADASAAPARTRTSRAGAAALAGGLLLALATLACGDAGQPWGSTESSDRGARAGSRSQATPPPTPDYRELTAVSPSGGERPEEDGRPGVRRPSPDEVTYPRAESLYREGEYGRAAAHFSAYVEKDPDNPWGHYMLGLSAWKDGDLERSVAALEDALERDPDHVKGLVNLGRVLLELDRPGDALPRLQRALELAPGDPDVRRVAGNVRVELGHPWKAVARYREGLTLDGSDAWSANNFGLVLLREGRYRDALGPLARAVELRPDEPIFRNNLGAVLERTGHPSAAAEAYRAAAESGHRKAEVSLARVEELAERGEPGEPAPEVGELARSFAAEVESWGSGPTAALAPLPVDDSPKVPPSPDTVRADRTEGGPTEDQVPGSDPGTGPDGG